MLLMLLLLQFHTECGFIYIQSKPQHTHILNAQQREQTIVALANRFNVLGNILADIDMIMINSVQYQMLFRYDE